MTQLISDLVRKVGFNDVDAENDGRSALSNSAIRNMGWYFQIGKCSP